jgi:hypothetical protein
MNEGGDMSCTQGCGYPVATLYLCYKPRLTMLGLKMLKREVRRSKKLGAWLVPLW